MILTMDQVKQLRQWRWQKNVDPSWLWGLSGKEREKIIRNDLQYETARRLNELLRFIDGQKHDGDGIGPEEVEVWWASRYHRLESRWVPGLLNPTAEDWKLTGGPMDGQTYTVGLDISVLQAREPMPIWSISPGVMDEMSKTWTYTKTGWDTQYRVWQAEGCC